MTQVSIQIKLTKIVDNSGRYVGMGIDEPLVSSWWSANTAQNLGVVYTSQTFTKTVNLAYGSHTIEAGVSSPSFYPWNLEIIVDGTSLKSGSTYSGANVSGSFIVGAGGITPEMKPLDRLKMVWQRIRSFIFPEESIEAL